MGWKGSLAALLTGAIIAAAIMLGMNAAGVGVWTVVGSSMEDTLHSGDIVFGERRPTAIAVNDVIVFTDAGNWSGSTRAHIIKRVIAVAGDRVRINTLGVITVNGKRQHDVHGEYAMSCQAAPIDMTIPAGRVFARGDNASVSDDSRYQECNGDGANALVSVSDVMLRADGFRLPIGSWVHAIEEAL